MLQFKSNRITFKNTNFAFLLSDSFTVNQKTIKEILEESIHLVTIFEETIQYLIQNLRHLNF
jgi:spore coat polysaccharide biosynthesis predicted glycosyltransferase SpsG